MRMTITKFQFSILIAVFVLFFILYPIPFSLTPTLAQTSSCSGGTARATGLVSTPSLTSDSKFNTSAGACVIDPKATFVPFKIPNFDDLKSLYFDQSKATKEVKTGSNLLPVNLNDDQKVLNYTYTDGDINVNGTYNYNGTAVIFIEGSIYINGNIQTLDPTKGLVLVVKNNVNIDKDVTRIDAVIISQGPIYTAGVGCTTSSVDVGTNALTINGSLISLDLVNSPPIKFCRALTDNNLPAELINQQPKYVVILRNILSDTLQKWSEIP